MPIVKVRRIVKQEVDVPGLGAKIKKARTDSSKSLSALCREVGISRNYWYQLESEVVLGGVAEDTLRKMEAALEVDFDVRFEDDEQQPD